MLVVGWLPTATEAASASAAVERTPTLTITRFEIEGNSLLQAAEIADRLRAYTGQGRGYADIQRALEMLEMLYRAKGYSTVQVYVPEQEIEQGVVRLRVIEAVIGQVQVSGNTHHDAHNVLESLAALQTGQAPNARLISQNVQLANQNPSKMIDVTLSMSAQEGVVDANVAVADDYPRKFLLTLENSGNESTGQWRSGAGFRHANLFNRDHVLTLNYTTSPEHVSEVKQYSLSYRLPLYGLGDSIDIIAAKSDVSTGTTPTVAGPLTFSGSGRIYGLRYNFNLPRRGEYSSRVIAGFDWREFDNTCSLGVFGSAGCGGAAADVTVHPLSVSHVGDWVTPGRHVGTQVGWFRNIPGGKNAHDRDFSAVRPNEAGGIGGADADYQFLRVGLNLLKILPAQWQARLALNTQLTRDALVPGEQFGLAGADAVRGFPERLEARDRGAVFNAELYTPEMGGRLGLTQMELRGLVFYDHGWGEQVTLAGEQDDKSLRLASMGIGLRYSLARTLSGRFDMARVLDGTDGRRAGEWRGHFSLDMEF